MSRRLRPLRGSFGCAGPCRSSARSQSTRCSARSAPEGSAFWCAGPRSGKRSGGCLGGAASRPMAAHHDRLPHRRLAALLHRCLGLLRLALFPSGELLLAALLLLAAAAGILGRGHGRPLPQDKGSFNDVAPAVASIALSHASILASAGPNQLRRPRRLSRSGVWSAVLTRSP